MNTNENLHSAIIAMNKLLLALRNDRASGDVHVRVPRLIDELSVACRSARELADRVGVGVDLEGDGYGTGAEGSANTTPTASDSQQEQKLNPTASNPHHSQKHTAQDSQQEQKPTTTDPGGEPLTDHDLSSIFDKRDLHAKEAKPEAAEEVLGDAGTHGRHSKKNENHSKNKK